MVAKGTEQFGFGELPASAIIELHLEGRISNLPKVFAELNALVKSGITKDYAIGGGYAAIYHGIPYFTYDLDVLIVLGSDEDYHKLYEHYKQKGNKIEDVYIYIAGIPVQFLPNYINPIFHYAIQEAQQIKVNSVPSKVVSIEYLIALLLGAFRAKDKIRISELIKSADLTKVKDILRRFDNGQRLLSKRLGEILGNS